MRCAENRIISASSNDQMPLLITSSDKFQHFYYPYIVKEWRDHYISYDSLKRLYQLLKSRKSNGVNSYECELSFEIKRMDNFLEQMIVEVTADLQRMEDDWNTMTDAQKKEATSDQDQRTLERALRSLYEKCKSCKSFHKLNAFLICKIAKKLEKLSPVNSRNRSDFEIWKNYRSHDLFNKFLGRVDNIENLTDKCIDLYSNMFRQSYPSLAIGELDFVKNKELARNRTRVYFGFKLGAIVLIVVWLIVDAFELGTQVNFWISPGLFVYTSIGSMLLFKALWALNVWAWARYNVNYISLLRLSNLRPNSLQIMNETADLFLLFFINVLFFCRANSPSSILFHTFFSYATPLTLVLSAFIYQGYEHWKFMEGHLSRGLFSARTLWNSIRAPFVSVTFRDNYASDVLTSFTKVISDTSYASCWVISGSFLYQGQSDTYSHFGTSSLTCTNTKMTIVTSCFVALPLWIRFLQCYRVIYDTGNFYPQLQNSLKYALSIIVVFYGLFRPVGVDYIILITVTTLYKWWWDVVMDWGLFEGFSVTNLSTIFNSDPDVPIFLRRARLYPETWLYYFAIVVDLLLRYIWVVSLMPISLGLFIGPTFKLFSGSLEIIRRSLWGHFRVEYEHIKFVRDKKPGFLDNRRRMSSHIFASDINFCGLPDEYDQEEKGLIPPNSALSNTFPTEDSCRMSRPQEEDYRSGCCSGSCGSEKYSPMKSKLDDYVDHDNDNDEGDIALTSLSIRSNRCSYNHFDETPVAVESNSDSDSDEIDRCHGSRRKEPDCSSKCDETSDDRLHQCLHLDDSEYLDSDRENDDHAVLIDQSELRLSN